MVRTTTQGLGNHAVVAKHPRRYLNPQVVRDALRAINKLISEGSGSEELKKLKKNCEDCLTQKWRQSVH